MLPDAGAPSTTQLTLGYSQAEDRLVLWLGEGTEALHLTRRLTGLLINGLAGVLARSSATAAQAPADLRNDVVGMERQGAIAAAAVSPAAPTALPPPGPAHLIEAVDIATLPTTFRLAFRTPAALTVGVLVLSRAEMHQVVDLLRRQSELAQWALPVTAPWLNDTHGALVVN
ncbi:hypothetical protein SAMN05216456_0105 [Devosia crocina]|uniref:Uncharacterized protein n=1 Tax=Devosia crocina TaxID=429728 RepID=A0A1I7MWE9_9HYPH|nr:hypothetical protein [Devosia crocina]SFV26767.1 hypothetical protein SAMN05216456_0105 [Devosia crocina]